MFNRVHLDIREPQKVVRRWRKHADGRSYFQRLNYEPIQRPYHFASRHSTRNVLSPFTIQLRYLRQEYYVRPPMAGVSAAAPFGVWSGRLLRHTHQGRGSLARESFRVGQYELRHNHEQHPWMKHPDQLWNLPAIDAYHASSFDRHLQQVIIGGSTARGKIRPGSGRLSA